MNEPDKYVFIDPITGKLAMFGERAYWLSDPVAAATEAETWGLLAVDAILLAAFRAEWFRTGDL